MFKWLTKWFRTFPSPKISYFWKMPKEGRVVLVGYAVGSLGFHLKVVPLGKSERHSEFILLSKGLAVDRKHWQELWDEYNKKNTFEWEEPGTSASVGKSV